MPQDWTTDEAEIPPNKSRQDMTLDKIGFARGRRPSDEDSTLVVVRTVIDNGDYEGFQLSDSFSMETDHIDRFFNFLGAAGAKDGFTGHLTSGPVHAIKFIRDQFCKRARLSAVVLVNKIEKDTEKVATYNLTKFSEPQDEASLQLKKEPTQFKRDV